MVTIPVQHQRLQESLTPTPEWNTILHSTVKISIDVKIRLSEYTTSSFAINYIFPKSLIFLQPLQKFQHGPGWAQAWRVATWQETLNQAWAWSSVQIYQFSKQGLSLARCFISGTNNKSASDYNNLQKQARRLRLRRKVQLLFNTWHSLCALHDTGSL